jgi:hypothetical protein
LAALTGAMDTAPVPRQSVSLDLEISRSQDGRLEGRLRTGAGDRWSPFSGVLELLKVLEDALDAVETPTHVEPAAGAAIPDHGSDVAIAERLLGPAGGAAS